MLAPYQASSHNYLSDRFKRTIPERMSSDILILMSRRPKSTYTSGSKAKKTREIPKNHGFEDPCVCVVCRAPNVFLVGPNWRKVTKAQHGCFHKLACPSFGCLCKSPTSFGVHIRAPDFWKLPNLIGTRARNPASAKPSTRTRFQEVSLPKEDYARLIRR